MNLKKTLRFHAACLGGSVARCEQLLPTVLPHGHAPDGRETQKSPPPVKNKNKSIKKSQRKRRKRPQEDRAEPEELNRPQSRPSTRVTFQDLGADGQQRRHHNSPVVVAEGQFGKRSRRPRAMVPSRRTTGPARRSAMARPMFPRLSTSQKRIVRWSTSEHGG